MICALESSGLLAYQSDEDEDGSPIDLPRAVQSLVDRGWVNVCRIEPWTAPVGRQGTTHGAPIDLADVPRVLSDPATWEEPGDRWYGAVTLTPTEAGWMVLRK